MGYHLITGGCGFVGRNFVKRLHKTTDDTIFFIDDLSVGTHPSDWLPDGTPTRKENGLEFFGDDERMVFLKQDARYFIRAMLDNENHINDTYGLDVTRFKDVFHFAAIVGGRAKIDGDPMLVALDLSIDAEFFLWVCRQKPNRVLYPSSSAAYPVDLQTEEDAIALSESDIDFKNMGQPDMTYGWSKLTGEYLAYIAAKYYGVSVTCIRPFSGYGEDQDLSYPIPAIARRAALKEDPFEVWGTGQQGRDFVHIEDVMDCTLHAMERITDGRAINIGSGRLTTFLEIIEIFTEFAGYDPEIKKLLDKPVGVHSRYADMSYVNEELDWKPKLSLREGMRRVYDVAVEKYA
ncbi:MAG: NAD-dependent epimerase/dehydratase family protein [Gracilimonas sp.]|uniref:NAD-dependent epimerase/dehydratase family protein n=1 Tax=Gracilimonas sp. TaxID=1974203 RepID=UPI001B19BE87|nr:NAD-dependent epimerase/dehydratase family protein [Gracilimonas sp.]MBO6585878.1 NAD-dependent epimerase/dehydratase family protein [Gracilimonas sp.]MBO6616875.1 NAD-dependent epimerase/dehydratase family protein [Gracilimonas sp.]